MIKLHISDCANNTIELFAPVAPQIGSTIQVNNGFGVVVSVYYVWDTERDFEMQSVYIIVDNKLGWPGLTMPKTP